MHDITVTREELLDASGNDETFRQLLNDLLAFSTRMEAIRGGFGKLVGLTGVEFTMLVTAAHMMEKGPVFVNALADHMHLSGAFVTLQTNKLAKAGLLKKVKDPEDGRRVMLQLTKKAEGMLKKLAEHQCQINDMTFAGLSKREFQTLVKLTEKLVDNSSRSLSLINYLSSESK